VDAVDLAIQRLGGVQLAAQQAITQAGPGGLALQVEGQAVGLGEALGGRDDQRGRVGQSQARASLRVLLVSVMSLFRR
jgi:hypothetical protein